MTLPPLRNVCPVILAFIRAWHDDLTEKERDKLIRPLLARTENTLADPRTTIRRSYLAADWLARVATPKWLEFSGIEGAARLRTLPEIRSPETLREARRALARIIRCTSLRTPTHRVRTAANAAALRAAAEASRIASPSVDLSMAATFALGSAGPNTKYSLKITTFELQKSAQNLLSHLTGALS